VSAIPEFIDSGTHGVLSDDAPAALADSMVDFASDPSQGAAMAEAAYGRLTQDFLMHPGIEHLKKRLLAMLAQAG